MARKRSAPMWAWLEENGYTRDEAKLEEGKRIWRRMYHREYQRKRRALKRLVSFYLAPAEYDRSERAAKAHKRPVGKFIKESHFAYLDQTFLVPDEDLIIELREEIALIRYNIERIREEFQKVDDESQHELFDLLYDRITYIDQYLQEKLEHPPLLAHQD